MKKTLFVTGASSGFGAFVSAEMARRGWHVVASMRDTSKSATLEKLVVDAGADPAAVDVIELDVTSDESRAGAVAELLDLTGHAPDVVFHCAGYTTAAFFEDLELDKVRHIFETNFIGALDVTRRLLPAMRDRGTGTIAVVSSNAVNIAHPMYSIYASSKWALEGWAEALQIELAPFRLSVKIIQPGNHDTPFGNNVQPVLPDDSAYAPLSAIALPKMTKLGTRARSTTLAATDICDALEQRSPRLRVRVGADDKAMAALARWAPYSVRRRFIERVTGITADALFTAEASDSARTREASPVDPPR